MNKVCQSCSKSWLKCRVLTLSLTCIWKRWAGSTPKWQRCFFLGESQSGSLFYCYFENLTELDFFHSKQMKFLHNSLRKSLNKTGKTWMCLTSNRLESCIWKWGWMLQPPLNRLETFSLRGSIWRSRTMSSFSRPPAPARPQAGDPQPAVESIFLFLPLSWSSSTT